MCVLPMPAGVRVIDFGIRGLDLAYELSGGEYDVAILVDAVARGGPPGTLYVIEPSETSANAMVPIVEAHALDPMRVLALARSLGETAACVYILGCEPARLEDEAENMGLSPAVEAALDEAIVMILSLIERLQTGSLNEIATCKERTAAYG
jgi:hydrogenase maturation protease